jgi:hypothetical protein
LNIIGLVEVLLEFYNGQNGGQNHKCFLFIARSSPNDYVTILVSTREPLCSARSGHTYTKTR